MRSLRVGLGARFTSGPCLSDAPAASLGGCRIQPFRASVCGHRNQVAKSPHTPVKPPSELPGHCAAQRIRPYADQRHRRVILALSQPSLGVSSLDLGCSFRAAPSFAHLCKCLEPVAVRGVKPCGTSALLTYAAPDLLQCKKKRLQFVRRTAKYPLARLAATSLVSLPSLGVSSLDLGRSFRERPLFFFVHANSRFWGALRACCGPLAGSTTSTCTGASTSRCAVSDARLPAGFCCGAI